jgi:hypothetical protein
VIVIPHQVIAEPTVRSVTLRALLPPALAVCRIGVVMGVTGAATQCDDCHPAFRIAGQLADDPLEPRMRLHLSGTSENAQHSKRSEWKETEFELRNARPEGRSEIRTPNARLMFDVIPRIRHMK